MPMTEHKDRLCPLCGQPRNEVERLLRECEQLRRWLRQAYKQRDTPARRARMRPRKQLDFPTSDTR